MVDLSVALLSVSIKLSDNDEVQALNREWRDKDKPTNVLSFPALDDDELRRTFVTPAKEFRVEPSPRTALGDAGASPTRNWSNSGWCSW